jgi:hypothetical protein
LDNISFIAHGFRASFLRLWFVPEFRVPQGQAYAFAGPYSSEPSGLHAGYWQGPKKLQARTSPSAPEEF